MGRNDSTGTIDGVYSSHAFPVLDLSRLAVLHIDASKSSRSAFWDGVIKATLEKCDALNEEVVTKSLRCNSHALPQIVC